MYSSLPNHHLLTVGREVLKFKEATEWIIRLYMQKHPNIGKKMRQDIGNSIYTLLRNREKINNYLTTAGKNNLENSLFLANFLTGDNTTAAVSALGTDYNCFYADRELTMEEAAELPPWLTAAMAAQYAPDFIKRLGIASASSAPLDLRVNTLKISRSRLLSLLTAAGIKAAPTPYSPWGIRLKSKVNITDTPFYRRRLFDIQDEGSQLVARATQAKSNMTVMDFCAGSGGKTLALANMMRGSGSLYAADTEPDRLKQLGSRLQGRGFTMIHPLLIHDEYDQKLTALAGKCDIVLVDAPCSGLGTLRRQPDLKYRQSPGTVAALAAKQSAILAAAAQLCRPGGKLVYATCSFLAQENSAVVSAFLAAHSNFSPADCQKLLSGITINPDDGFIYLDPVRTHTDGFFIAVLVNSKGQSDDNDTDGNPSPYRTNY